MAWDSKSVLLVLLALAGALAFVQEYEEAVKARHVVMARGHQCENGPHVEAHMRCPPCTPRSGELRRRVRRELRTLDPLQWQRVSTAMMTIKNLTQEEGEAKYGPFFKTYDYFAVRHAVSQSDLRGDQAHFSPAFGTWHASLLLQFENALLAVDPLIEGLPYWDSSITAPSVFSPEYVGSIPGGGELCEIIDGPFAYFPIPSNFTMAPYERYIKDGSTVDWNWMAPTGFLRGGTNLIESNVASRCGIAWSYERADFETCRTFKGTWNDWFSCVDLGVVRGRRVVKGEHVSLHSGAHVAVGGNYSPLARRGDFKDLSTSPNDPLFMFHHANLDRSRLAWMGHNSNISSIYWGFPIEGAGSIPLGIQYEGINLNDVMASSWPFTFNELGLGDSKSAMTHADAMCNFMPSASPYVYIE